MNVIYDVSRLATRSLNITPNGIDWIDALLANHFLSDPDSPSYSLLFGFRGPRLFAPGKLPSPVPRLDRAWGRDSTAVHSSLPDWLAAALQGANSTERARLVADSVLQVQARRAANISHSLRTYLFAVGSAPLQAAPHGAVYLNAAHFPLEQERHVVWLESRRDIKPVIVVHDLLPILQPQVFWTKEPARHARRLAFLARRGAGAIVTSQIVADALDEHLTRIGRRGLPILKAAPPVVPMFRRAMAGDPRLKGVTYFVACGTIEPRKNHMLLIEIWRRLVARHGSNTPKLLIVGKRGWHYEQIVRAMHDPTLQGSIIEASGLSTGAYRTALAGACALLSPSFAEGFGLPLAEALAAGTPAIASDIPSHREQGGQAPLYIDPTRVEDWADAIADYSATGSRARQEALARMASCQPIDPDEYTASVACFMRALG